MMTKSEFLLLGLLKMARGSLLRWTISTGFVLAVTALSAQERVVQGTVTSPQGQPIVGVSIHVNGTSVATSTGEDGRFSLSAATGAVLMFSNVGYMPKEYVLGSETNFNITLLAADIAMDEVVVIGYGTQRKEAVTGSVASISGDNLRDVPSANISQALQGRLPGVDMSQTSSKPGAEMQIRIRGTRSLTAGMNDPLVVLDGIPFTGSIGDINPNDVKSIDILKDASATAIYGSRGANGVILVTTNKGQYGQQARVAYNSFQGVKNIFSKYPMMNGSEFVALREAAGQYQNGLDESDDVDTDWQDLFYQTGNVISQDVGISSGTDRGSYNFGGGYFQEAGIVPSQKYSRISLRGTVDQQIGNYFRVGFMTNNNYNLTEGSQIGLYGALTASPIVNPYNADGTWKRTIRMPADEPWTVSRDIIEGLEDQWLSQTRAFASYNSMYGEISIPWVEGLKYRTNLGLDYRQSNGGAYTGVGVNNTNPETPSTASVSNSHIYHWVVENLLTYDRTFATKHHLNLTGLYSAEQNRYVRSRMAARDIPAEAFQFYNLGHAAGEITINPDDQIYEQSGLLSWMGRAMYSYDDRYMLTATLRSDGSSRLATGHKWHTYPAISVGWNVKKESFMNNVSLVDMLKLRVGYGQTSNQAITPYSTLGRLATRPYNFGDNGEDSYDTGRYVDRLPNPDLGWEYSQTWNYGVDFSLLNSRLSGTIEYYITNTKDLLLSVGLPSTSGVSSYTANIGQSQNKGVELSLNGVILENKNGWTWEAGVNLYANRNKLVALDSGEERDEGNWWFVGHPIDVVYDYEKIGLWQEGDAHRDILEPGGNAGMIKVKYTGDYNADGTPVRAIGDDDRQIISLQPNFQGGFNTRVAYKNIDLSAVGVFQNGGILISTLHSSSGYLNMLSGRRNNVKVDYWTPENIDAKYPAPGGVVSNDNPKYGSTLGYFDASHLKIRTLQLGYNFDSNPWINNVGIDRLRLYFTVQNPFVLFSPFNKETGMDPETNSYGDENAAVTTTYRQRLLTIGTNSPQTRSFLFGINLIF